jgi:tripeptide aminopeptidase
MSARESLLERFVRYAKIDTQSSDSSTTYPSTEKQKDLLRVLVDDLKAAGLDDAAMDSWGYVMATLPSNVPPGNPAYGQVPTIGLIAHVDTYYGVSGTGVQPQVHAHYDGGDIVLSGDPSQVIRVADEPELAACKGLTIVTTDGKTLLGADDKAGVAVILETLWRLKEAPSRPHGPLRIGFTPDEEVGRGTEHFDVEAFGATYAYTVDGAGLGSLEAETFCADTAVVTVTGTDAHPGYAKHKMVNAVRVVSAFLQALPQHRTPETTEGRESFLHPISMAGSVSEAQTSLLVRAFTEEGLLELENVLRETATFMEKRYPRAIVRVEIKPSYRNMKYVLDTVPHVADYAEDAIRRAGLPPQRLPVRGGTDGSRLSFMGLPTPNIFNGSMNFHGLKEWVPVEWMDKAVEATMNLLEIWVERAAPTPRA